jgi:hypothetical protein
MVEVKLKKHQVISEYNKLNQTLLTYMYLKKGYTKTGDLRRLKKGGRERRLFLDRLVKF